MNNFGYKIGFILVIV